MKAATVAASRGHKVKLIEASSELGGQVNLAQRLPGRSEFGGITTNLANKLHKQNVEIKFQTKAFYQQRLVNFLQMKIHGSWKKLLR